uniref:Phorbol-ester/DAG-type domain-containing protein n=1 Tax=Lactuca sativa TaxID=4236 RepID=A0A9R1V8H6_LACSA|nr:hypothetical protein LSAT_V11C600329110 [Lactuca sativa]
MEEINHFILMVVIKKPQVIGCNACDKPISSGFAYACTKCRYVLHKACAQLPPTFNDPSIYHHPLTLTDMKNKDSRSRQCDVCRIRKTPGVFSYIFIKDNKYTFAACIDCCVAIISLKAEADAIKEEAKIKDEGLFYECDSCDFWIHKTCASLASTIHLPHHPNHPLVLVYSLSEKFFNFPYYCEICNEYILRNEWLYQCANCRYFAHIKCALHAEIPSTATVCGFRDDDDVKGLLHFPMSNAFTDPLKLLHFEKMSRSHHHPLILTVEAQANNMSCSSDLIEMDVHSLSINTVSNYLSNYNIHFTQIIRFT